MRRSPTLTPASLPDMTPTRAEALRACPLRAAFDASPEYRSMVLREPAARIGTACHEVLEATAKGCFDAVDADQLADRFEHLWSEHIAREEAAARRSPQERHFGPAVRWPYYALKRAYLYHTVQQLIASRAQTGPSLGSHGRASEHKDQAERDYKGFGGKLRGRADHVAMHDGRVEIEDYKTGAIFDESDSGIMTIKAGYQRQILLYAALHWDETGVWPQSAHLIALQGERFSMDIEPDDALRVVHETLALLNAYNRRIESGASLNDLATPSEHACEHCPYKPTCDPFWDAIRPDWSMRGAAYIEGIVTSTEDLGARGLVLEIDAERGNGPSGRCRLRGITTIQYPEIDTVTSGTKVRIVGARIATPDEPRNLLTIDYTQIWWDSLDA